MDALFRLWHCLLYLVAAGLYGLEALGSVEKGALCTGLALVYLGLGCCQQLFQRHSPLSDLVRPSHGDTDDIDSKPID